MDKHIWICWCIFSVLLETIFQPIPSELIFPLIGFTAQTKGLELDNALGIAIVGALGSTIGSIAIYLSSKTRKKSISKTWKICENRKIRVE